VSRAVPLRIAGCRDIRTSDQKIIKMLSYETEASIRSGKFHVGRKYVDN
jgi:hypothetical protein